MRYLSILLLWLFCLPAQAEEVVLGLSHSKISINTTFDGSDILLFGAVKREVPIPYEQLGVVLTIAGPQQTLTVRRKERRFGIWMNTDRIKIDHAPSFYVVATSDPWGDVLSEVEDLRHKISIPRAIRAVGATNIVGDAQNYTDALIRIRKDKGVYKLLEGAVTLTEQTLFSTAVRLPADLTEGDYTTRIFLTRNGQVVSEYETVIDVGKVGLERWLFGLSREQPFLYGLMALALAALSGWGASALFRVLRQG